MGFRLEAFGLKHEPGCRDSGKEIIGMFQCPEVPRRRLLRLQALQVRKVG